MDELLARLDEIKLRFREADWATNKKNVGADKTTMRLLSQQRNSTHGLNNLTSEAPVSTEYDTEYSEDNYNNYWGFDRKSSMQSCYSVACAPGQKEGCSRDLTHFNQHPVILDAVQKAVQGYAEKNNIDSCGEQYSLMTADNINCKGVSGGTVDYGFVTGVEDSVVQDIGLLKEYGCSNGIF